MKILLVSSEVAPFAKTGGLADVAGALPLALQRLGLDVRVAMPGYANMHGLQSAPLPVLPYMDVKLGWKSHVASITKANLPGSPVPVYFVDNPSLFHRPGLYQENGKDYPDNAVRFAFFCKAVLWMLKGLNWIPDIIHCNDWQTGLLPVMLRTDPVMRADDTLSDIRTMFTIHNLAYQGIFPGEMAAELGFGPNAFNIQGLEFYGNMNCLKGGLAFSDILTTVSPTYAKEIQTPELGAGLDGVLRDRADHLHGILNGIDYTQWNPETDQHLAAQYHLSDMAGKAACKAALQMELGLARKPELPLLVMISRLDPQKGLDILIPLIDTLMARQVQIAILGTGHKEYHEALETKAERYKGQMAVRLAFDNGLAHRMEAGGDLFLMPSRYEPCGLNQLYSLRYGTLPVVRNTGGLADSVEPITISSKSTPPATNLSSIADASSGTGFVFEAFTPTALLNAIEDGLKLYSHPDHWKKAQTRAMNQDFSWDNSAKEYLGLYQSILQ